MRLFFLAAVLFASVTLFGQAAIHPSRIESPRATDSSILMDENANLKSDLAQLRSMLNVLASQESGMDARSFGALQTNRQMWQVIIARLAELTQRIDALEQKQHPPSSAPAQTPQH